MDANGHIKLGYAKKPEPAPIVACNDEYTERSYYSQSPHVFTCGATADSLLACWMLDDGDAGCLRSATSREVVTFKPDIHTNSFKSSGPPSPFLITLTDGRTCEPAGHDQGEHPQGLRAWYYCGDQGSLLLLSTDEKMDPTDRSTKVWTAKATTSPDAEGTVTTVKVASVTYAG